MKHNDKGPMLPGDDDLWESLATNLFGIDFSKPAIPEEEVLEFDLTAELEPVTKPSKSEEVPPDEDVQLNDSAEDDAGFPDDEVGFPEEDDDVGFPEDDEEEALDSVEIEIVAMK